MGKGEQNQDGAITGEQGAEGQRGDDGKRAETPKLFEFEELPGGDEENPGAQGGQGNTDWAQEYARLHGHAQQVQAENAQLRAALAQRGAAVEDGRRTPPSEQEEAAPQFDDPAMQAFARRQEALFRRMGERIQAAERAADEKVRQMSVQWHRSDLERSIPRSVQAANDLTPGSEALVSRDEVIGEMQRTGADVEAAALAVRARRIAALRKANFVVRHEGKARGEQAPAIPGFKLPPKLDPAKHAQTWNDFDERIRSAVEAVEEQEP